MMVLLGEVMTLEGGINFRDLGGYATADGRQVKKGHFFRSGSLSGLTTQDCQKMESLSVKYVIDYRDRHESEKDKDVLWSGVHYECCPANPPTHVTKASGKDFFASEHLEALPADYMETLYQNLPFGNSAYKNLFQKMESLEQGALLHHCAVGKDRTGVGSALLLLALGVDKETVLHDYLLTDKNLHPFKVKLLNQVEHLLSAKALKRFEHMMAAQESFLHSSFAEIENRYQNIENYFATEYGLSQEKLKALQSRFLK
ncbi:tyrosine-protein phosphatase [Bdellovibrio sp.]|uniref:tyrosine-protein phosphatase n=1 Tax=Bdellovibrio sp. TaxID=28201 RepID=UPI0039E431D6